MSTVAPPPPARDIAADRQVAVHRGVGKAVEESDAQSGHVRPGGVVAGIGVIAGSVYASGSSGGWLSG